MKGFKGYMLAASMLVPMCVGAVTEAPDEFSELFEFKERPVSIKDVNGSGMVSVVLSVNYNTVKLPKEELASINVLKDYFKRNLISVATSEQILADLKNGIKNTESCRGYVHECVVVPDNYEAYYDYDSAQLTFFVNGAAFENPILEVKYADAFNANAGIVNHFDFYSSAYHGSTSSYAINNKSIKALPYGHLTADFAYTNSMSKFYELSYDVSFADDRRFYVGQFDNGLSFNSTDIISPVKFVEQKSFNFGSTSNLTLSNQKSYEKIYFFAPAPAEVRVLRDQRIIKVLNVAEGRGVISYADLPSGRYDIDVQVLVSGEIISSEKKTVFNDVTNVPLLGESDFLFTIGQLNKPREFFSFNVDDNVFNYKSRFNDAAFASTAYSMRVFDSWLVAFGGLVADGSGMGTFGSQLYFPFGGGANGSVSIYQPGTVAFDTQFYAENISIQYEKLRHQQGDDTLASYLMGDYDYEKVSGNLFYTFDSGLSSYYSYTKGKYSTISVNGRDSEYNLSTLGFGYNLPWDTRVDVTLDYDHAAGSSTAFLNFLISLGGDWEAKASSNYNTTNGSEYRTGLVKRNIIDAYNVNSSMELSSGYSNSRDEFISEMYGSIGMRQSAFLANANLYANNDNNYGFSGSMSSSQIISENGIDFTSERADAYTVIDIEGDDIPVSDTEPLGFVTLRNDNRMENKKFIYGRTQALPVNAYNNYNINVDTESLSLYNSGQHGFDGFAYPGSTIVIKPNLKSLVSFVSSFSNVFDEPVDEIMCEGFGCIDVTKVMDGVFRVTLVEGSDFKIYAGKELCLVPRDYDEASYMNFGNSYCLPDASPRSAIYVTKNGEDAYEKIYYAGVFNDSQVVNDYVSRLSAAGSVVYKKKIGGSVVIYISLAKSEGLTLTAAQQKIVDSMQVYVRGINELDIMAHPVVSR